MAVSIKRARSGNQNEGIALIPVSGVKNLFFHLPFDHVEIAIENIRLDMVNKTHLIA